MRKRFYSLVLMVAGLLCSTSMWADNVAKVGETNYEDINEAFSAWVTNGGTLTILDDVTFTQTKSMSLENMEYTLDLGGRTLTWNANLNYSSSEEDVQNKWGAAFKIPESNKGTILNIKTSTEGGNIIFSGSYSYYSKTTSTAPSQNCFYFIWPYAGTINWESGNIVARGKDKTEYLCAIIYVNKAVNVNILSGSFTTEDWCQYGLYASNTNAIVEVKDCSFDINDQKRTTTAIKIGSSINSASIDNVIIDASGVSSSFAGTCVDYSGATKDKVIIKGGTFTANNNSSACAATSYVKIEGGTFNGVVKAQNNGIIGGNFAVLPEYKFAAEGYVFQQDKTNKYYKLISGTYQVAIPREGTTKEYIGFVDEADAFSQCSKTPGTYTNFQYIGNKDITIPQEYYLTLTNSKGTGLIKNYGDICISGVSTTQKGNIENYGTLKVTGAYTLSGNLRITNYRNMEITYSATFKQKATIANKQGGTLTIKQGTFGVAKKDDADNNPIITNEDGGMISIEGGKFQSSVIESLAQFVVPGFIVSDPDATNGWRTVATSTSFVAKVGDAQYTKLDDALAASSQATPAKLINDYILTFANGCNLSGYLDLNGYSIIGRGVYSSYPMIEVSDSKELHILDSSVGKTGKIYRDPESTTKSGMIIEVARGGTLYLEGGTISTIGEKSVVTARSNQADAIYGGHIIVDGATIIGEDYGIAVFDYGTLEIKSGSVMATNGYAILNNGSMAKPSTIIISGGTVNGSQLGIYHPGKGTLTITGGAITGGYTGVEIRAGELNMSGGTINSTYDSFECDPNGNGATTVGAALAIAQHTTKQPITVNISQGHFDGYYAVSQCNPQENPDEYLQLLNIEVIGGYFWSSNGANIISVTENRRLFLKGGVYNLDPAAFTVEGYFSLTNQPELYAGSYAQGYVYKVAQQEIKETETKEDGTTDWAQNTTWNPEIVPDYATNVTIGKDIVVTTSAEANKITINEGTVLTVKEGGTLIIGNGGIIGATTETFKVENGGQVLIAPNAENATLSGSIDLLADRAGLKPSVASYTGQGSEMYWQHIAIPTQGAPESITPSVSDKTFFNTWDIMKGWQNVGTSVLNKAFKGYNLGNFHPYSADGSQSITYTFVGQLVGNQPSYMVFAREGHSFFGNSYLAPLDVATMLGTLYQSDLEYTINVYDSQNEIYAPVNEATALILGIDEIKPLQGFFIYAANATQAQLDYNSAVFTAYLNKHAVGGQPSTLAPARKVAMTNTYDKMAQITIAATTGEKDAIYLFEEASFSDAEDNGFDARNLEHSGLDMSIVGSYADLSVLATDNLEGALLNINTNNAVEYTMTFSHMQGDMTLTDNVTGAVITMGDGTNYTFVAQPNARLKGRFAINATRKTPTNNENITINPAAKGIYTMMGQYVGETSKWNALPAGVYVVDGVRVCK